MRLPAVIVGVMTIVISACSPAAPVASESGQAARRVEVRMTDDLRFVPATFEVHQGETIEFVVHNDGRIRHEFFVGDIQAHDEHEMAMTETGGMRHDEEAGIFVDPGNTKSLNYTFVQPGTLIAGCHEPGHYASGMQATIVTIR